MSDKIQKKEPGTGLVKANGAPNLSAMQKKRLDNMPTKDKLNMLTRSKDSGLSGVSLQVVVMFDITGSMFKYFDTVRKKLQEIVAAVKKESPGAEFAIHAFRNHGDEIMYTQIFYASPLTSNLEEIQAYIAEIERGGGGHDALTCMEECLHEANGLSWDPNAPKAVVVIGDEPPHGVVDDVSKCSSGIDYRQELSGLKEKGVKIYSVFCPTHKKDQVYRFFQSLAETSDGKFMEISEIEVLAELLIGICLKETGNFDKFVERLGLNKSLSEPQKKKLLMLKG